MSRPWSKTYRSLQAAGGTKTVFTLPFPSRCRISRVVVTQVSGGDRAAFTAKLFDNRLPATDGSGSSGGGDPAGVYEAAPVTYQPLAELQGVDGDATYRWEYGFLYENQDGHGPSSREYQIYLEIDLPTADARAYDVAFSCELP